jgi:hypothetical protein
LKLSAEKIRALRPTKEFSLARKCLFGPSIESYRQTGIEVSTDVLDI